MNVVRWLLRTAAALFVATILPAQSQGRLDADALKLYGGTYSSDCSNPTAPKGTVFAEALEVAGTEYVLASSCKNHDCGDNNTVLLYSAAQGVVYGKIFERGRSMLIGAPSPAVASALGVSGYRSGGRSKGRHGWAGSTNVNSWVESDLRERPLLASPTDSNGSVWAGGPL